MLREPSASERGDPVKGAGLLEEVGRAGNHFKTVNAPQPVGGLTVELEHLPVRAADNQQRGRSNGPEPWAGEVRTTAAGDDRAYPRVRLGSGPESGSRSRACTEVTDARYQIAVRGPEPASRGEEATGQKLDVEDGSPVQLLLWRKEIKQQCPEPGVLQHPRDRAIAWAVTTAPAPMGKQNHAASGRQMEVPFEPMSLGWNDHVLVDHLRLSRRLRGGPSRRNIQKP